MSGYQILQNIILLSILLFSNYYITPAFATDKLQSPIIDRVGNNYLLHLNAPFKENYTYYDAQIYLSNIEQAFKSTGLAIPEQKIYLHDVLASSPLQWSVRSQVSVYHNTTQEKKLQKLKSQQHGKNNSESSLNIVEHTHNITSLFAINWGDPNEFSQLARKTFSHWFYYYWDFNDLEGHARKLRQLLDVQHKEHSQIVVVYCSNGISYSRMLIGAYQMLYQNMSLSQMEKYHPVQNIDQQDYADRLAWFCWHLYYREYSQIQGLLFLSANQEEQEKQLKQRWNCEAHSTLRKPAYHENESDDL